MEEAISALNLEGAHFLRPSMILGPRKEKRLGENIGKFFFDKLSFIIPSKYQGVEAMHIAKAMMALAKGQKATQVIESKDIAKIADYDA
jgi:hypothetical protein